MIFALSENLKKTTAACASAVLVSGILHPFDLVKTRLQVAKTPQQGWDVIRNVWKIDGVSGLYKGLSGTVIASGISWAVFRYLFELTQNSVFIKHDKGKNRRLSSNMVAGALAGGGGTLLVHPLWFVKTRLELQSREAAQAGGFVYRSWGHCVRAVAQREGVFAFYRGLLPALLMAPHAAIQIGLYEELRKREVLGVGLVPSFVWGATSKASAAAATYPLQVVRSRQQENEFRKTVMTVLKGIAKAPNVRKELYKGFSTNLQRICLYNGLMFCCYEWFLKKAGNS